MSRTELETLLAQIRAQTHASRGRTGWGMLLGATVGLSDEDAATRPPDGGGSVAQVLGHVLKTEETYLKPSAQPKPGAQTRNGWMEEILTQHTRSQPRIAQISRMRPVESVLSV